MTEYERLSREGEQQFYEYTLTRPDIYHNTTLTYTTDPYCRYDVVWEYKGKTVYGEIKKRNFTSNCAYSLDGVYFEKSKYESLRPLLSKGEVRYITIFSDNTIYSFDIRKIGNGKIPLEKRRMNKATAESTEDKVEKLVYRIKLKWMKRLQ